MNNTRRTYFQILGLLCHLVSCSGVEASTEKSDLKEPILELVCVTILGAVNAVGGGNTNLSHGKLLSSNQTTRPQVRGDYNQVFVQAQGLPIAETCLPYMH